MFRFGELVCGFTALMGILSLCLFIFLDFRRLFSGFMCLLSFRGLGKFSGFLLSSLVGRGDELGIRESWFILEILGGGLGWLRLRWFFRRLRLFILFSRGLGSFWMLLRFFRLWMVLGVLVVFVFGR